MPRPDLNLLTALDALLTEASVAAAARRLRLSPSAMSRTLARLRAATGDPLLARAGRGMALTPHAKRCAREVRDRFASRRGGAAAGAEPRRRDDRPPVHDSRQRGFRRDIRRAAGRGGGRRGAARAAALRAEARQGRARPCATARSTSTSAFSANRGRNCARRPVSRRLRRRRARRPSAAREGGDDAEVFAAAPPRRGDAARPADRAGRRGARGARPDSATSPSMCRTFPPCSPSPRAPTSSGWRRAPMSSAARRAPALASFALPVPTPEIAVSQIWHPRFDADPAHRWLRGLVFTDCRAGLAAPAQELDDAGEIRAGAAGRVEQARRAARRRRRAACWRRWRAPASCASFRSFSISAAAKPGL